MRITAIDTIQVATWPHLIWVRVHTDAGLVGLGETCFHADAVAGYVHAVAAPYLLGKDPTRIDLHSRTLLKSLMALVAYQGSGAEVRAVSALDIALWDILGQVAGLPIHALLGGLARDEIRVYNTCNGYRPGWKRGPGDPGDGYWRLLPAGRPEGPYEDLEGFINRADELAASLLEEGIDAMKIYPFNAAAEASGGLHIAAADLHVALEPFRRVRARHGDRIDVMVDFHSLWNLPQAKRIARALEPFEPYWLEDPVKMDNIDVLADYAASTRLTVCGSETLGTRAEFREVIERRAVGIVMFDVGWVGGISEARKIAAHAETHHLPVAPHDATGPVALVAGNHVVMNAPNGLIQEIVRSFYSTWYRDIVTALPAIERGRMRPLMAPGLGTQLQPDLLRRKDVRLRTTAA
ncbi:MAG: mandelate racemase/muconate lactonizing enzyme family protein [Alphaproteobacteria bacterium]|nr:mandelate racemase/muconate lactonizing enzyme family protein [Alphaproteobacteria bacterium]